MISKKDVPEKSLKLAMSAYTAKIYKGDGTMQEFREAMLDAIVEAINGWPDAYRDDMLLQKRMILLLEKK